MGCGAYWDGTLGKRGTWCAEVGPMLSGDGRELFGLASAMPFSGKFIRRSASTGQTSLALREKRTEFIPMMVSRPAAWNPNFSSTRIEPTFPG